MDCGPRAVDPCWTPNTCPRVLEDVRNGRSVTTPRRKSRHTSCRTAESQPAFSNTLPNGRHGLHFRLQLLLLHLPELDWNTAQPPSLNCAPNSPLCVLISSLKDLQQPLAELSVVVSWPTHSLNLGRTEDGQSQVEAQALAVACGV